MTILELNRAILDGHLNQIIDTAEDRHKMAYSVVASKIATRSARIVLLCGPSSSGKTTSSMRLGRELSKIGLNALQISLDNYFVERSLTPRDELGNYDFESLKAVNVNKFNEELLALMNGECVYLQKFNFKEGTPGISETSVSIDEQTVIIVEGLHALNPKLTQMIEPHDKYKIYINAISPLQLNPLCEIRPRDNVLMRRMIRDHKYRGRSAKETLTLWPMVRHGERLHIMPFEDESDVILDTSLSYEISVLKPYITPLLIEARDLHDAKRLLQTLECFEAAPSEYVPQDSVLREYIGGSCFEY